MVVIGQVVHLTVQEITAGAQLAEKESLWVKWHGEVMTAFRALRLHGEFHLGSHGFDLAFDLLLGQGRKALEQGLAGMFPRTYGLNAASEQHGEGPRCVVGHEGRYHLLILAIGKAEGDRPVRLSLL